MDQHRQKHVVLLASCTLLIAIVIQYLRPFLLPHGPAVAILPHHRPVSSAVDPNNTSLRFSSGKLTRIVERVEDNDNRNGRQHQPLLVKPETVMFDNNGVMYIMNENAKLISLTDFEQQTDDDDDRSDGRSIMTAKATEVADLGMGRPLGGKFDEKGCLYFADVILGLARICNLPTTTTTTTNDNGQSTPQSSSNNNDKPNVELLASRVKLEDGSWSPILYADDVDIGPKTGHVYFSDATDVKTDRENHNAGMWDIMYSSKTEAIRGKKTGRLLRYKPESGEVDILVPSGAAFANGVAVDKDETYILYTSTFEAAVMKYHLTTGDEKVSLEPERLLDGVFTGFLDGADCSFRRNLCYIAIPNAFSPLVTAIFSMPSWMGKPIRTFLMMIPRTWTPDAERYGGAAEIHPGDDDAPARIVRLFQDPDGSDAYMVTGVTEHEGKLYLGSLHNNFVSVVSLD